MLSPSDFNNAVPQFTNGTYASNPINPQYVNEPTSTEYNQGVEPLQTLPAQWWNWFINKFTGRFNKINTYVKNIFNELTELLSLGNITPDGTEATPTTCQLKDMFASCYPDYVKCCTTGTACGCIPIIGTDLGNTNNNILVTDASGQLKPSGITVGTAAGCDASCFSVLGNIPACEADVIPRAGIASVAARADHRHPYPSRLLCVCTTPEPDVCDVKNTLYMCAVTHFIGTNDLPQNKMHLSSMCSYYCCCDCSLYGKPNCISVDGAVSICPADSLLQVICKGRTNCIFCTFICTRQDVLIFNRPLPYVGCNPGSCCTNSNISSFWFVKKGTWLYYNCCSGYTTECHGTGLFGTYFCFCTGSTTYPGSYTALKCFTEGNNTYGCWYKCCDYKQNGRNQIIGLACCLDNILYT